MSQRGTNSLRSNMFLKKRKIKMVHLHILSLPDVILLSQTAHTHEHLHAQTHVCSILRFHLQFPPWLGVRSLPVSGLGIVCHYLKPAASFHKITQLEWNVSKYRHRHTHKVLHVICHIDSCCHKVIWKQLLPAAHHLCPYYLTVLFFFPFFFFFDKRFFFIFFFWPSEY